MGDSSKFLVAFMVAVGCLFGFNEIRKRYYGYVEPVKKEWIEPDRAPPVQVPVKTSPSMEPSPQEVTCNESESLRTMSTRWETGTNPGERANFAVINDTVSAVFVKLWTTDRTRPARTFVVMPSEKLVDPITTGVYKAELQSGTRWCNRLKGWSDGINIDISNALNVAVPNSTFNLRIGTNAQNGGFSISFLEESGEGQLNTTAAGRRVLEFRVGAKDVSQDALGSRPIAQVQAPIGQPKQNPAKPLEPESIPFQPDGKGFRESQDWRDIPAREIKLHTRGGRQVIKGAIGHDQVEFDISKYGYSAINEELAEKNEAYGCNRGSWMVDGTLRNACLKKMPRITIGGIELEHVMMVVTNGISRPVLGTDLLRNSRLIRKPDGDYLQVGRQ